MSGDDPILELRSVSKRFPVGVTLVPGRPAAELRAVTGVSLVVRRGETLGLVGESGCGKSTLARCIIGLHKPSAGEVWFDGVRIDHLSRRRMRPLRARMQMVFQDPYASLNPRQRVGRIIATLLSVHGRPAGDEVVAGLLEGVGLAPEHADRYPHEFSGGQRQRIGIARALALAPELVIADEPVSALDVSVQAQVLNLLADLKDEHGLTYVFIAHDLGVIRHISDRVAVMYLGRIVEIAPTDVLFRAPRHPYTRALLDAVPVPDPVLAAERIREPMQGDVPSPVDPPPGCAFHPRCPRASDRCRVELPLLTADEHAFACHHPIETEDT